MSKPAKNGGNPADVPFEEALKRLESIVESMETEDLPLETLLEKFEEGTKLSKMCQTKLAEAEIKIQQLERQSSGEIALKPVSLTPENDE